MWQDLGGDPQLSCTADSDPYALLLLSPRLSSARVMLCGTHTAWGLLKEESPPDPFQGHGALLTYKVLSAGFDYL